MNSWRLYSNEFGQGGASLARRHEHNKLRFDFRSENEQKLREPGGMCRPRGSGNQTSASVRFVHREINEGSARPCDVRRNSRITTACLTLQNTCRSEHLGSVAHRGDGLIGLRKMAHNLENARIEPDVLGCTTARDH